jgi:hypothetical protein
LAIVTAEPSASRATGKGALVPKASLGHSQVGTTEWYTHIVVEHMKNAADNLFTGIGKGRAGNETKSG